MKGQDVRVYYSSWGQDVRVYYSSWQNKSGFLGKSQFPVHSLIHSIDYSFRKHFKLLMILQVRNSDRAQLGSSSALCGIDWGHPSLKELKSGEGGE